MCGRLAISRATFFRWRRRADFRTALVATQKHAYCVAIARLTALTEKAVDRLGTLIGSDDERVALAAATAVLKAGEAYEFMDLEAELIKLRERIDQKQAGPPPN